VGKGVPAALMMSAARASLRAHAEEGHAVHETLGRVNRDLCRDTRPEEFATIWYGVIDAEAMALEYASAGHDKPILVRPDPARARLIDIPGHGMVAGVDDSQSYALYRQELRAGDVLVVFTDGVTDAMNFEGKRFGRKRLTESIVRQLEEMPDSSAGRVLDAIFRGVRGFTGLASRTDDRTVVVVRIVG
jgi:sigma-B regulation protein RsbU (phosphoserine phosphatase)